VNVAGLYIAVEGGEGAGKSTQVEMLADAFWDRGIPVVRTREPGGTDLGQEIRQILLRRTGGVTPSRRAEALLYAADRSHHVDTVVRPALLRGRVVIQDRSVGSSLAYQSGAGGLSYDKVAELSAWGTDGIRPHMTFYLDIDPEEGLRRASARGETNRFEDKDIQFHREVRSSFRMQAQAHNWFTIDARESPESVHEKMFALALTEASLFGHQPQELEKQ
jgi:dTMP kinase